MQDKRAVLVPPRRLAGWVHRFGERNGAFRAAHRRDLPGTFVLTAENGCTATVAAPLTTDIEGPGVGDLVPCETDTAVTEVVQRALVPRTVGLILIRRGGYGVGVAREGALISSRNGTRYVQSRTAAGGWSQQRFARRRENQADALVSTTAQRAAALFEDNPPDCLQPGGDAKLFLDCLGDRALVSYRSLPRLPLLPVPDPRQDVLRRAAADTQAVRIILTGIPD